MRTLASMTEDEANEYMRLLGQATKCVIPPDALFVLCVFGPEPDKKALYISDCRRLEMPKALHELADKMAADIAKDN